MDHQTCLQRLQTTDPTRGGAVTVVWQTAEWLILLLIKSGDVETNPGPTNTRKKVWIYDICHRQIQVRKQISLWYNMIEHWVHLRCAGIRLAQYTDTWTCHQHKESRLTTHTDLTPPYPGPSRPPTPLSTTHTTATKHRHISHFPPVPSGLVKPKLNIYHNRHAFDY